MKLRFRHSSKAVARACPVASGGAVPKPKRAAVAGFAGRLGEVADVSGRRRRRLLLGMGARTDWEAAGALAVARLHTETHIALEAPGVPPADAARLAAGAMLRGWRLGQYRTLAEPAHLPPERCRIERIDVLVDDPAAARREWARIGPGVAGAAFARDLVVEPGNHLTPAAFAARLASLEADGITVDILDADELRAQGFGGMLAVGGGSANPPCLAVLSWRGSMQGPPLAFVGKGVTFDTGGVCLKPGQGMWEMRADMAGAATCAGTLLALARRRSPVPAVAVLALAENAIGAASYRPSDVLRMFDGTSVEVVDTDAEGRVLLADALAWTVARLRPLAVIDLGTLTGSIVTALGHHMAGMFATDDALAAHLAAAGAAVGELAWRMPLAAGYREALDSDIADLRQCSDGERQPDACHCAAFLRAFVGDTPWAHLDIAGVESQAAATDRHAAGPTGWGVRLLDQLVADRFEEKRFA